MASRVAVTTGAPGSVAAFAPTLPTRAAGDRMLLFVIGKYGTTTTPTINQGWTLVHIFNGTLATTGNDVGSMFIACYAKDATASETAPTVTPGATAPNSWEWICVSHRPGAGKIWRDGISILPGWTAGVEDSNTAAPLTGTVNPSTMPTDGDCIFAVGGVPTDLGTALGTTTITMTGLSGGTKQTATTQYVENALGNDTAAVWTAWEGFTGTPSAGTGIALSMTITGASNQNGSLMAVVLRETNDPNPIKQVDGQNTGVVGASRVSAAFTPPASSKVYVAMWAENTTAAYTFLDPVDSNASPLSWTRKLDITTAAFGRGRLAVFESSDTGSSPGSRQLTLAASDASTYIAYAIFTVEGGRSITQISAGTIGSGTTRDTGALAAAATNGHIVVAVAGHNKDGGAVIPAPAGWTPLFQGAPGGGQFEFVGVFYRTDFTGTSVTFDTSADSGNQAAATIMELDVAGAPPPTIEFEGWGLPV